jgi:hypothetical protein
LKLALNTIALKDARLVMVYKIANEQVAIAKKIDSCSISPLFVGDPEKACSSGGLIRNL